jgi:hypothetical protein
MMKRFDAMTERLTDLQTATMESLLEIQKQITARGGA